MSRLECATCKDGESFLPEFIDPEFILQALPYDLSICFHEVVWDVSARQILQSGCVADFNLKKDQIGGETLWELKQIPPCHLYALDSHWQLPATCGGGRPPAPGGHSGSIFLRPSQLHSHKGDGFSMVQFPFKNMWLTVTGTSGIPQSSSGIPHKAFGSSLGQRGPRPWPSVRASRSLLVCESSGASLL